MNNGTSRETLCIKVEKTQGEKTLRLTHKLNIADQKLKIQSDKDSICIPLARRPNKEEEDTIKSQIQGFTFTNMIFSEKVQQKKTLESYLADKIEPSQLSKLPRAVDIIGDIAIVEIPPELKKQGRLIGEAILESHRNIKTVFSKASAVTGEYRLRELNLIAGEQKSVTLHKEFGCTFSVDVAKAYFSPRLSQEHKRIASLTRNRETVVDLFAGIGPFSILISKANPQAKVYAIDINPEAVKLLENNARINRVENQVIPILGDARKIVEDRLFGVADRVIMNLPESAIQFVETACKATKPAGGIVHFYGFVREPETTLDLKRKFCEEAEKSGRKVNRFLCARKIRETAPYEWQVALDAQII